MLRTMICSQQPSTSTSADLHQNGATNAKMASSAAHQVVALAVIARLHEWCVQLFWITILCVIGCVGDERQKCSAIELSEQRSQRHRKSSSSEHSHSRTKNIAEIEMKLLRHLTSPQLAACRPVVRHSRKRHAVASRPPSPQLFDIREEPEEN